MKFTSAFSVGIVFASALTATTALPVNNELFARDPVAVAFARSFDAELQGRSPFDWGSLFTALKPIAKPWVAKIPKVGGFLSQFFKRDGSLDEELLARFLGAGEADVAARSFEELDARAPFSFGSLFKILKPLAKPFVAKIPHVGGFLSRFFKRDDGEDDLLGELLYARHLARSEVIARTPEEAIDAFANALLADLEGDNSVVRRALTEIDAREPFVIPPGVIDAVIKNAPAIIKTVAPIAKKVVNKVKKFFKKLFRRDTTDADVDSLVADLFSGLSRRDAEVADAEVAWNDFVKALNAAQ